MEITDRIGMRKDKHREISVRDVITRMADIAELIMFYDWEPAAVKDLTAAAEDLYHTLIAMGEAQSNFAKLCNRPVKTV